MPELPKQTKMKPLLDNFYTEVSSNFSDKNRDEFSCDILLNPEHPVYKGHFEQVPVAPGVCLTQVIKEIVADKLKLNLMMSHGDNIKFLSMINPRETPKMTLSFTLKHVETSLEVSANYSHGGTSFVKFKGKFKVVDAA